MASPTSPTLQRILRTGLLAGALLDSALAAALVTAPFTSWLNSLGSLGGEPGSESGGELGAWLTGAAVSYSWLISPALAARAGLQGLSCYDSKRYDQVITWLALTLVVTGIAAWRHDAAPSGLATAYGLVGTVQLIAWRWTR